MMIVVVGGASVAVCGARVAVDVQNPDHVCQLPLSMSYPVTVMCS